MDENTTEDKPEEFRKSDEGQEGPSETGREPEDSFESEGEWATVPEEETRPVHPQHPAEPPPEEVHREPEAEAVPTPLPPVEKEAALPPPQPAAPVRPAAPERPSSARRPGKIVSSRPIEDEGYHRPIHERPKRWPWIAGGAALVVIAAVLIYIFMRPDHSGEIVIPYISHQKPVVDPHLPSTNSLSDKLDEVEFDGLFNLVAGPSGIVYEDGLGQFVDIDQNNVVSIKLKTARRWHDSWLVTVKDDKFTIAKGPDHLFAPADLNFTLKRILQLGSLSPDYILISQALANWGFEGPDLEGTIRFQFRGDRIWKESDIKEVLSFKILPDGSPMNAENYKVGTASYLALPPKDGVSNYYRMPDAGTIIPNLILAPFIDNSTYTTELRNNNINLLLDSPFGSLSPILEDTSRFFVKSNISNTFFALFFNTAKLNRPQRIELRRLINNRLILNRFFKVGTQQARHVVDYKGNRDNYADYLNRSVFPSSTYYVEDSIVTPLVDTAPPDLSILPDTVRIQASVNSGFREEYSELIDILNDPTVTRGKVRVTAVSNDELQRGNYDAVLVAISGYRSNFLFDLYTVFLRDPNLETYRINLQTVPDGHGGLTADPMSFRSDRNFFRLDAARNSPEAADIASFLQYLYGFMSTHQIGDKQEYARRIDDLEHQMCLGAWLFSMPSLAYFSTQFDASTIDLYGVASQLSTVKKWRESTK